MMSNYEKKDICIACNGSGNFYHNKPQDAIAYMPCTLCEGTGKFEPFKQELERLKKEMEDNCES